MKKIEYMKIEKVFDKYHDWFMSLPGVVGVGIGEHAGRPVIGVMVKELTPELKEKIPTRLEGFEVKVEVTGEITALSLR